jgi:hypothetical protein
MYLIGFVLRGGGARGFAHLGIIQALAEMDIHPDIISGVSAGAIVGAFLASGRSTTETHQIIKSGNLFKYTHIQIPKTGILRMDGLQKTIEREIPYKNIEDLPIPSSGLPISRKEKWSIGTEVNYPGQYSHRLPFLYCFLLWNWMVAFLPTEDCWIIFLCNH